MTQVRALKKLGRYHRGDVFEQGRTDANLLAAMGFVELVKGASVTSEEEDVKNTYSERSMEAKKQKPAKKAKSKSDTGKRTYRRRDMVAE